ncbi:MAG: endonuclease/exonuclease/phosphatase family protein [Desulfobacterales bacterium]|jgi:endonuclease/exonuclease/phosphatase family metal-dependent hydrolase
MLKTSKTNTAAVIQKPSGQPSVRAMTYNIHSCVNTDGSVRPEQVAAVIDELTPDLVALQEVDANIPRTHNTDQAKLLAKALGMDFSFFPVVKNGDQKYGLAILSRFPFQHVRVGWLPTIYPKLKLNLQKRGVIWAIVETSSGRLHFFNTHLSLYRLERRRQSKVLIGKDWLMAVPKEEPVIFCGDLNAGPLSPVYRRLSRYMTDAQKNSLHSKGALPTFPSRRPLFRIDHIFTSQHFRVLNTVVPINDDTRLASDHLPLCADLQIHT